MKFEKLFENNQEVLTCYRKKFVIFVKFLNFNAEMIEILGEKDPFNLT